MRITSDMTVAGVPILLLRDAFRKLYGESWLPAELATQLNLNAAELQSLIAALLAEGYIEPASMIGESETCFATTIKGNALAIARATRPISRAKAEQLVAGVIDRAKVINDDPEYCFFVSKILAFGSYLTAMPNLGDVDLAVELTPKVTGPGSTEVLVKRAKATGRRFSSFLEMLIWPREEIMRALRNRSTAISIHSSSDEVLRTTTTRLIYAYE